MQRSGGWRVRAYLIVGVVAVVMGVFVLRIPVQLSDSFTEFQSVNNRSLWEVVANEFQGGPYMRPLRRGLIKVVYGLSGGRYQAAFRGFQVLQLVVLLALVMRALPVRSRIDSHVVPMSLALLLGGHTFAGAILEGLPINHFLTIIICCAAALVLARAKPSVAVDVGAVVLMLFAMLTIESGLVVAAVLMSAYAVGYRGVSRWALAGVVLCVLAYGLGRFVYLGGTTPGLDERSAGFGFRILTTEELLARFGENPLPFYLYNVASAVSSVLFAEPRGGVFAFTADLTHGHVEVWRLVSVGSSTLMTMLLGVFVARRRTAWRRFTFETDADRLVVMFAAVLAANAVFAFAYEKDAILGPAGLFYALASTAVLRELARDVQAWRLPGLVLTAVLGATACGWAVRLVGIHYSLQVRDLTTRNEWVYSSTWLEQLQESNPLTPKDEEIRQSLWRAAIRGGANVRQFSSSLPERVFDVTQ